MTIINLTPLEKDKETLCLLKQALYRYNQKGHYFDIDQEVDNSLILFEISLKALTSYYISKYEKTHFFNNIPILTEIKNKINMPQEIVDIINKYKNYANKYYPGSRYGKTGLKSIFDPDAKEITSISEKLFLYVWKELQGFIDKNREELGLPDNSVYKL